MGFWFTNIFLFGYFTSLTKVKIRINERLSFFYGNYAQNILTDMDTQFHKKKCGYLVLILVLFPN